LLLLCHGLQEDIYGSKEDYLSKEWPKFGKGNNGIVLQV